MRARALTVTVLAILAAAHVLAGFAHTDHFLPMAGRQPGLYPSDWYTTVWIHNPGSEAAVARIYFLERNATNLDPPWVDVTIAPGDTEMLDNVVENLFHLQAMGALRVTCATQKLLVSSRVFTMAAGATEKDSLGQDFSGVPATFAIGLGERSQVLGVHLTQPKTASACRYNYGFVETTGRSARVRVTVYDGNNALQGSEELNVPAFSQLQKAFADHFPAVSTENSRMEVEVISGQGKVIAYGSMIANGSTDPTTFEMAYPEHVLAENVASPITEIVAGDGLFGGGAAGTVTLKVVSGEGIAVGADNVSLADGGVTQRKLSAGGGAAGQVLGSDGSALRWQDDGLKLPQTLEASSGAGTDILTAINTGSGRAFHAIAGNDTAMWAESGSGTGLDARSAGAGKSGIYGESSSPTGRGVYGKNTGGGIGVRAWTTADSIPALLAENEGGGPAVFAESVSGPAVKGVATLTGIDGFASSATGTGVWGHSTAGEGVKGESTNGAGVHGVSASKPGVFGESTSSFGVKAQSANGTGVWGGGGAHGVHAYHLGGDANDVFLAGATLAGEFRGAVEVDGTVQTDTLAGVGNRAVYSTSTGVLTNSSSDGRLKRDVVALADEIDLLAALERLRGVAFNWDASAERAKDLGRQREIGLIAQEVEGVLPYVVGVDADGYRSLDYAKLTAFLIEVAKAQQAEIRAQRSALADIEARLARLEVRRSATDRARR